MSTRTKYQGGQPLDEDRREGRWRESSATYNEARAAVRRCNTTAPASRCRETATVDHPSNNLTQQEKIQHQRE
jgi:hypothetical protein